MSEQWIARQQRYSAVNLEIGLLVKETDKTVQVREIWGSHLSTRARRWGRNEILARFPTREAAEAFSKHVAKVFASYGDEIADAQRAVAMVKQRRAEAWRAAIAKVAGQ